MANCRRINSLIKQATLKELGIKGVAAHIYSDSMLVMKQLAGEWRIKEPQMKSFASEVHEILREFNIIANFSYKKVG